MKRYSFIFAFTIGILLIFGAFLSDVSRAQTPTSSGWLWGGSTHDAGSLTSHEMPAFIYKAPSSQYKLTRCVDDTCTQLTSPSSVAFNEITNYAVSRVTPYNTVRTSNITYEGAFSALSVITCATPACSTSKTFSITPPITFGGVPTLSWDSTLDVRGLPIIIYYKPSFNSPPTFEVHLSRCADIACSKWKDVTLATVDGSYLYGGRPTIALAPNGNPIATYTVPRKQSGSGAVIGSDVVVANCLDPLCKNISNATSLSGGGFSGYETAVAFTPDNTPLIAYTITQGTYPGGDPQTKQVKLVKLVNQSLAHVAGPFAYPFSLRAFTLAFLESGAPAIIASTSSHDALMASLCNGITCSSFINKTIVPKLANNANGTNGTFVYGGHSYTKDNRLVFAYGDWNDKTVSYALCDATCTAITYGAINQANEGYVTMAHDARLHIPLTAPLNENGLGWISLASANQELQSGSPGATYAVAVGAGNAAEVTGYAWSENVGWIDFQPAGPYPALPNHGAQIENSTLTGWARIVSIKTAAADTTIAGGNAGGWDGWIKLSGKTTANQNYGVTYNLSTKKLGGYAWSNEFGWINFNGTLGDAPPITEICGNGIDDDSDTITDGPNCPETGLACTDGYDNDGDGKIDATDPDCSLPFVASCAGTPTSPKIGDVVTWEASILSAGTPPYSYVWTLANGNPASGAGAKIDTTYASDGVKQALVKVSDTSSPQKTFDASCTISVGKSGGFNEGEVDPFF